MDKSVTEEKIDIDDQTDKESTNPESTDTSAHQVCDSATDEKPNEADSDGTSKTQQERTFLIFSDFKTWKETFHHRKPRQPQQKACQFIVQYFTA